ncbi:MAG: hypothetical protein HY242_03690 [Afipia sp.]|nr:hypothetical protein [Afipia sp.]
MKKLSDRYKADITRLVLEGKKIAVALQYECDPASAKATGLKKEDLTPVRQAYQSWYSEALACVTQLLPSRVDDFVSYYKPLKPRKSLGFSNYVMSDYLFGKTVYNSNTGEYEVATGSALSSIFNQYKIVEAILQRLDSTLFDIRALVHADLLDDELAASDELNKHGFPRGAGAIAGVVLEAHLAGISDARGIKIAKNATISTLNDTLRKADVLDTAAWRFIQHLGDIRNKCDHKGSVDPTANEVKELIDGVRKITKTVF